MRISTARQPIIEYSYPSSFYTIPMFVSRDIIYESTNPDNQNLVYFSCYPNLFLPRLLFEISEYWHILCGFYLYLRSAFNALQILSLSTDNKINDYGLNFSIIRILPLSRDTLYKSTHPNKRILVKG